MNFQVIVRPLDSSGEQLQLFSGFEITKMQRAWR